MLGEKKGLITYIKEINFELNDFLLMFGFLFSIPFYAFAWKFMVTSDPNQVFFNTRMIITCFAITIICWALYFILEIKKGRIKNHLFTWVYVFMAIVSVVAVLIQKNVNTFYVECKNAGYVTEAYYPGTKLGDIVEIVVSISPTHRLFFTCASFVITTILYIVLIVLPKRIKNMNFLVIIGIITMIFMFGMCIYSYISEAGKYGPFLNAVANGDWMEIKHNAMYSFVVNSVPYGVCMMLALMFAILTHSITGKHYWYIAMLFFIVNMLFSYCRTAISISFIIIILYLTFRLIATFRRHKIRNIILTSLLYSGLFAFIGLNLASFFTGGLFLPLLNKHQTSFFNTNNLEFRKNIWGNINNELKNGWWIIGRGFGTHNSMLYPMNLLNNDNVCPSHSTYYAILGAGGISQLIGFFGLMAYYVVLFIKSLKKNKTMPIALSFPLVAFLAYSFTEGVNYLIVTFTFPLILYYHILYKKQIS